MDLKAFVRDVPEFPVPGVLFRDITPLLRDARAFRHTVDELAAHARTHRADAIVGIESRGFVFGAPVACALGLPFVPVRKPGKLPAARMSVEIALEYGNDQLDIHADALHRGERVLIIDDLLATGGTATGATKLVELLGAKVTGLAFVIELAALGGRERLEGYDVHALLRYD